MRCPAIEGIETETLEESVFQPDVFHVECVAPLLRGLKPKNTFFIWCSPLIVECVAPLLRGLKRSARAAGSCRAAPPGRMRCPAIEGIETSRARRTASVGF